MSPHSASSAKPKVHQPSNFTVKKGKFVISAHLPKGKWYDCLRPVPGYQGFGGLGADSSATSDATTKEELEAQAKLQDYTTKVPSFHKAKPNKSK